MSHFWFIRPRGNLQERFGESICSLKKKEDIVTDMGKEVAEVTTFIYPFIHPYVYLALSAIHPLIHESPICLSSHPYVHPLTHSSTHPLVMFVTYLFASLPIHPCIIIHSILPFIHYSSIFPAFPLSIPPFLLSSTHAPRRPALPWLRF